MFESPLYLEILRTESVHDEPTNSDTSGVNVIWDIPALVLGGFHFSFLRIPDSVQFLPDSLMNILSHIYL